MNKEESQISEREQCLLLEEEYRVRERIYTFNLTPSNYYQPSQ